MITCRLCVHVCVCMSVCMCAHMLESQVPPEFWMRKMALHLFECLSSPKGSCVQALPWPAPVIILLWKVMPTV